MSLMNKVLNFVGWEAVEEEINDGNEVREEAPPSGFSKKNQNKVVSIHNQSQFKVVIMHPENFDDAKEVVEHLKNKKPIVINLEEIDKEFAQRLLDFLSGAVCAVDGCVQKVSSGIFVIAPNNVDVMGEFKEELKNKALFPWAR